MTRADVGPVVLKPISIMELRRIAEACLIDIEANSQQITYAPI